MPVTANLFAFDATCRQTARTLIDMALAEDLGAHGDITTRALPHKRGDNLVSARIIAKAEGVIAGLPLVFEVFARAHVACKLKTEEGERVAPRMVVAELNGEANAILTYERTALNFLQRLSGIATHTHKFVETVAGTKAIILDTRKTTPGWRALEKYAVRCGGGKNHRMGLHDMFLIKENHIAAAGGIGAAVQSCRAYAQTQKKKWRVEVEAKNWEEVEQCLQAGVDQIMLDNMPLADMRHAVQLVAGRVPLEASGNVTLERIAAIAATGVDYISSGSLTHSAPALDFSLLLDGAV